MDPAARVVGLNPQTNMVFTVVKPVMGLLQVSPQQTTNLGLQPNPVLLQPPQTQTQALVQQQIQVGPETAQAPDPGQSLDQSQDRTRSEDLGGMSSGGCSVEHLPFAEVSSLLDPNMKGSKATPPADLEVFLCSAMDCSPTMDVTIQRGDSLPNIERCSDCCSAFHCPFCFPKWFRPTRASKVRIHLRGHFNRAIQHEGFTIHRCGRPCRLRQHYHCPYCHTTVLRKDDFNKHLDFCSRKVPSPGKYLISYDEIRRRLQPPEKMSLRSIAAYTRVSRGPASKKTLLESLNVLGLSPSTTTSVSSSFSKLTEGDTRALCEDMKDFSHDYIDYENMAKQLIPKINTVQHWSKIIETKNHLEDMRRCFQDPANSQAFDSVTHGLGLGMLDVVLDMVSTVIQHQVRILSGTTAGSDPGDPSPSAPRRIRKRNRKFTQNSNENQSQRTVKESVAAVRDGDGVTKAKGRGRGRKRAKQDGGGCAESPVGEGDVQPMGGSDILLVTVGYEAVSNELTTNNNEPTNTETIQMDTSQT